MNDALDASLVLPEAGDKPSKPYRSSPYTVRQYYALPYAQRLAVDTECDEAVGLVRTAYDDERSPHPYTIGRRTLAKGDSEVTQPIIPIKQKNSPAPTAMLSFIHPAPSPALHTLNTPEAIHHDARHPDSLTTYAVPEADHEDFAFTSAGVEEATPPALTALTAAVRLASLPPTPAAPLAHDGTVYETTDYDLFHLLPENRDIDPNQVRKLVGMIQKSNLLHLTPILVTPELGIIDGQHRRAAAQQLGLPIFYKVGQQLSEADITTLNTATKNWTGADWLKYWAVKRKPAYVALADFMQRHPRISFSNAKIMLTGNGGGGTKADVFRTGQWDGADDEDMVLSEQVAGLVERVAAEVPSFKSPFHTGFVTVLYHCLAHVEGFDAKELLRTILLQPRALVTCASHKQWLQLLSDLYNYRKNEGNRLRFT